MNIFMLDKDTTKCAQYHCDSHVVKMCTEYAQIMSTVHHICKSGLVDRVYKKTHENHPAVKWAAESTANYLWLYDLWISVCEEFERRFQKEHKSYTKFSYLLGWAPDDMEKWEETPLKPIVPSTIREKDPVLAYRRLYREEKRHLAAWTGGRETPEWFY